MVDRGREFELGKRTAGGIEEHPELAAYLDNADHVDVKTIEGDVSLRHFVAGMLSYDPWWIVLLYQLRTLRVAMLGLVKHETPAALPSLTPEKVPFEPGETASFFVVRAAKENAYWVSETPEDKHLTAFFGVVAAPSTSSLNRFHVFTSVRYLHWTGPVYFNIIRPFHHLVVSRMMKAGIRQ